VVLADGGEPGLDAFRACATAIRAAAFDPLVAPPALLYLTSPAVPEPSWIDRAGGRRIVVALAAVLGVALIATLLLASRLLRPIRRMTRATQRMASNERGTRVRVRGNDELARLGRSFNAMADSIEAGERQRQQLVSDVAHELRNPLANARGYLEGAQDGIVQLDAQLVEVLLDETVQLQHLVEDLQDVALADAGRLPLHVEPIDVADLAAQVLAAHAEHARRRGVLLVVTGDRSGLVEADPVRLRQVLSNLVANSLRYTSPRGRIEIDVANRSSGSGAAEVRVAVIDTGVGIDAEHLPHVFDRFYRADASRARGTGGSGLGLAICKYLVDAHGGVIDVASRSGRGTTFTITLPALAPARDPGPLLVADSVIEQRATRA
jgi:two-component system sensor histidine kinase BaeS